MNDGVKWPTNQLLGSLMTEICSSDSFRRLSCPTISLITNVISFYTIEINTVCLYRFIYSCSQFASCFFPFLLILFLSIVPSLFSSETRSTSSSREEESNAALRSDTPTLLHTLRMNPVEWTSLRIYFLQLQPISSVGDMVHHQHHILNFDFRHIIYELLLVVSYLIIQHKLYKTKYYFNKAFKPVHYYTFIASQNCIITIRKYRLVATCYHALFVVLFG